MSMRIFAAGLIVALTTVFMLNTNGTAGDKEKPKFTISEVMKKAHIGKDNLREKVIKGEATDEEKAQLTALYVALSLNTPPKGEADDWKKTTKAILEAYKANDTKAL